MIRQYALRAGPLVLTCVLILGGCGHSAATHDSSHASGETTGEHPETPAPAAEAGGRVSPEAKPRGEETEHDESEEHGEEPAEADFAHVEPSRAASLGIVIAKAASGSIAETVTLTGRLIIDPKRVAEVRARFPGPVVRIHKDIGDPVRLGEALADVESNESLTVYSVLAPLTGVVLERHTNVGDVAGEQPLYRVGDVSDLQAELKVFPSQRTMVSLGAAARVQLGSAEAPGHVIAIAPEVEGPTQAINVRVKIERPPGVSVVPAQFVTALVEHGRGEAAVVVSFDAVQRLGEREVVFVPETNGFRAKPVKIGRRAAQSLEIREGLAPGTPYVAKGAFLLKAEIGKSAAADED